MSKKNTNKKQFVIGTIIAGAVSAACMAGMKLIDKKMQKKKEQDEQ